ncbi:MAG: hypothetical protein LBR32_03675 [Propionibacteriaceae bacterium]|jgi:hypothetical protein|nr:hypothetical protein [Propionibacteriaceae bacterium]
MLTWKVAAVFGVVAVAAVGVTAAAFTDSVSARLGSHHRVGGEYNIAFQDGATLVEANPTPIEVDTTNLGAIPVWGAASEPSILMHVVQTGVVGEIRVRVENGRAAPLPSDPGVAGPGADPYDVILYTLEVDGVAVASHVTAADLEKAVVTGGWRSGIPREVRLHFSLAHGGGNPYRFDRGARLAITVLGNS